MYYCIIIYLCKLSVLIIATIFLVLFFKQMGLLELGYLGIQLLNLIFKSGCNDSQLNYNFLVVDYN